MRSSAAFSRCPGGETVLRDGFEVLRKPFEFGFPGQQAVEKQQPEKFEVCRGDAALLKRVQVDEAQLQPVDFDRPPVGFSLKRSRTGVYSSLGAAISPVSRQRFTLSQ